MLEKTVGPTDASYRPCISSIQSEQTFLSWMRLIFLAFPQKTQAGSYFFRRINSPSTNISIASLMSIFKVLLSSMGKTTRPKFVHFSNNPCRFHDLSPFLHLSPLKLISYRLVNFYLILTFGKKIVNLQIHS